MLKNKNDKQVINKGAFEPCPTEVIFHIMFFLDPKSLAHLARTNSIFQDLVYHFPEQIHVVINKKTYDGVYSQIHTQFSNHLKNKELADISKQKREREILEIKELRNLVTRQSDNIQKTWDIPLQRAIFTQNEKAAMGLGCVIGIIGGSLIAYFISAPWLVGASLGLITGASSPLAISRVAHCCCGVCMRCRITSIQTREQNLDNDYPAPNFMNV